jgi:hypothetical protein
VMSSSRSRCRLPRMVSGPAPTSRIDTGVPAANRPSWSAKLDYVPAPGLDLYGWGSFAIGALNGDRRLDLAVPVVFSRNGYSSLSLLINTPGLCNVQNVLGMRLLAAKRTLARINCRVGKVRYAVLQEGQEGSRDLAEAFVRRHAAEGH